MSWPVRFLFVFSHLSFFPALGALLFFFLNLMYLINFSMAHIILVPTEGSSAGAGKLRPAEHFLQPCYTQCKLLVFFVLIEYHLLITSCVYSKNSGIVVECIMILACKCRSRTGGSQLGYI